MSNYKSKILATGSAFPARRVSNNEIAERVETSDEWIFERTGIRARRVADPKLGETTSEFGFRAAKMALSRAQLSPNDIDLILFATVTPDHSMPNTACIIQEKLGCKRAGALDLSAACSGFVYGLSVADAFIRMGQFKNILLLGGEVLSSIVNWDDRGTCILFGDGAGSAIITRAEPGEKSELISHHLYADGWSKDLLHVPAGGSAMPLTPEIVEQKLHMVHMKGKEIFKVAVKMLADCATEALEKNGYTVEDLDWFVPHQANLRIIEAVARRLDLPMSKVILNIEEFANTSAGTVPTAFDEAVTSGKIKRGDLVLFDVFGAGITYGSSLFRY